VCSVRPDPFAASNVEDWWRAIDINLRGQILCAHRVAPRMIARRSGRIVNIVSGGGAMMLPYFSDYVRRPGRACRFRGASHFRAIAG
jgi:NAD(P)-dependent dehydrogenase (short-subunit alcohol dehydrogenase family)